MSQAENGRQEAEADEAAELYRGLAAYLDARPEVGLLRMTLGWALEPPDPFKPAQRRRLRKWFVIGVIFSTALIAWFAWFNILR